MSEWKNFGDVNFAEDGGILLKAVKDTPDNDSFEFVEVYPLEEDHMKYGNTGIVCVSDYMDKKDDILECTGILPAINPLYESYNEGLAFAIIEYYGGPQLGGSPLINDSAIRDDNNPKGQYFIMKSELSEYLNNIGFENTDEELKHFLECSNKELAREITDFIDIWEEDMMEGDEEDIPFIVIDEEEEYDSDATCDNIEKILDKNDSDDIKNLINYLNISISDMMPEDGLIQKGAYAVKALENHLENDKLKESNKNNKDFAEKG